MVDTVIPPNTGMPRNHRMVANCRALTNFNITVNNGVRTDDNIDAKFGARINNCAGNGTYPSKSSANATELNATLIKKITHNFLKN